MKVKLRSRPRGKKIVLYLEISNNGERKIEYLKQYLIPPPVTGTLTKDQKQFNKEMETMARAYRDEIELDIHRGKMKFADFKKAKVNFLEYYGILTEQRKRMSSGNYGNWESAKKHLETFCLHGIPINEISSEWLEKFKQYLNTHAKTKSNRGLSQSTKCSYYQKVIAALKQAVKDRIITENPADNVKRIEPGDPQREYLTKQELKKLYQTECSIPVMKEAFLFSCFTGLRWSDVQKLTWNEVRYSEEIGNYLVFKQQKTGSSENLPVPENAMNFIGQRVSPHARVFVGLRYSAWNNLRLQQWVMKAGVNKVITFHCARHTNAFLLLDSNTDIYTVSKMLGHRHLKTTEIYSHIHDNRKMHAAKRINFDLI
jgi:integrase